MTAPSPHASNAAARTLAMARSRTPGLGIPGAKLNWITGSLSARPDARPSKDISNKLAGSRLISAAAIRPIPEANSAVDGALRPPRKRVASYDGLAGSGAGMHRVSEPGSQRWQTPLSCLST